MAEWAVKLDRANEDCVSRLRGRIEIKVCATDGFVWVRGRCEESPDAAVVALPGEHFAIQTDGQLLPQGKRVPLGYLPKAQWRPVDEWVEVELPVARWAPGDVTPIGLRLISQPSAPGATAIGIDPTAMLVGGRDWLDYADTAAEVRLKRLQFAVATDGRVLVKGSPLPPLPGTRFVIHEQIAVPAGLHWTPAVDASIVRRVFGYDAGLVLWQPDMWEFIPDDSFAPATRAAIRETLSVGQGDVE